MSDRQIVLFGGFLPRRLPSARQRITRAVVVAALLYWLGVPMALACRLLVAGPGAETVMAAAAGPDGWRFKVTQEWGRDLPPFEIRFYSSHAGQPWVFHYVDHEATLWRRASIRIEPDKDRALLFRGREIVGTFDFVTAELYLASRYNIDAEGNISLGPRRER